MNGVYDIYINSIYVDKITIYDRYPTKKILYENNSITAYDVFDNFAAIGFSYGLLRIRDFNGYTIYFIYLFVFKAIVEFCHSLVL